MDRCWYQATSQCPPWVAVVLPAQAWCNERLAACLGYVKRCNQVDGVNITIDLSRPVPYYQNCADRLNECTKQIAGVCELRSGTSPIATATGYNWCPREAMCIGDAKFCDCSAERLTNCSLPLTLSSDGAVEGAGLFALFVMAVVGLASFA